MFYKDSYFYQHNAMFNVFIIKNKEAFDMPPYYYSRNFSQPEQPSNWLNSRKH